MGDPGIAKRPGLFRAHVAEDALHDGHEIRSDGVLAPAQFRRALVVEFAHDEMAWLGVGVPFGCAGLGTLEASFEPERRLIAMRCALGVDDSIVVGVGVVVEILQRRIVERVPLIRQNALVHLEPRRAFAHGVRDILVLLGSLGGGVEVGDVHSHALKLQAITMVFVEPHTFRLVPASIHDQVGVVPVMTALVPDVPKEHVVHSARPRQADVRDTDCIALHHAQH